MAFQTTSVGRNDNSDNKPKVDYNAMNEYVVETAQLQQRETLIGVVSGIIDLGEQEQPDAEIEFNGTPEDEAEVIQKFPNTYFKQGLNEKNKPCRLKCYPQKPVQAVVLSIDFPDIIIDKGQFFGESNPQPLRLFTGGQFWNGSTMIVGRPTYLKVNKSLGEWSFDVKHALHKMAVAAKLIQPGEVFLPNDIDQLLGKAFQFEAQVFFKESKGKKYYTEYLKFVSGLGRGQVAPELDNPPFMLELNGDSATEESVRNLRSHIINTIKLANNYECSKTQALLEGNSGRSADSSNKEPKPEPTKPKKTTPKPVVDDDIEDCPF
jgi:hypothetical protein